MSRVLAKDLAGHGITQSLQDPSMRAIDNLSRFKSHIKEHEMNDKVTKFEETILFYADAYRRYGNGSKSATPAYISSPSDSPFS